MREPATAVVIVGGGLSGLTAAAHLGRTGVRTIVFDEARELGGRAKTEHRNGFHLNYGPHRLYAEGPAVKGLRRLGIEIDGARRGPNGGIAVWHGHKHTLPVGFCSLLTTGMFDARAKQEIARLMTSLRHIELEPLEHVSIEEWVRIHLHDPNVIQVVLSLVRYTTYSDDLNKLSASAALDQLRLSTTGAVLYVHHGWGTLIASLQQAAALAGAEMVRERRVTAIDFVNGHATRVGLEDGTKVPVLAVIIATGPQSARRLLNGTIALKEPPSAVRVAALDMALRRLPNERAVFALGIDEPWCYSADSAIARVAPRHGAVVHLAKYLRHDAAVTPADEQQLEAALDLLQPGWRDLVEYRRFLPTVAVSHALVTAQGGGFSGRHPPQVPGLANVFLAGDWVGPTGQLADASVASGIEAARLVKRSLSFEAQHHGTH